MKLYISGKMSGVPYNNFPRFHATAQLVRDLGHEAVNPAEFDSDKNGLEWEDYLRRDIAELIKCDGIVMIEGWQTSAGARLERHIAEALNMPIFTIRDGELVADYESVLDEAKRLVSSERRSAYGHPYFDYTRTAGMVTAMLKHKLKEDLIAEDLIKIMICVKLSRETNSPKRDNRVDIAGYAECLEMVVNMRRDIESESEAFRGDD